MSKGNHAFKETEVARTIVAVRKAGLTDFTLRIVTRDGRTLEIKSGQGGPDTLDPSADEWKVAW